MTGTAQLGVAIPTWAGHGRAPRFSKPCPAFSLVTPRRVHGLEVQGRDCGEAAAEWVTSFLKSQPYRLVHFEPHMRPRKPHQMFDVFRPKDQVRGGPLSLGLWGIPWEAGFLGCGALSTSSPSGRGAFLRSSILFCQVTPRQYPQAKIKPFPREHRLCFLIWGWRPHSRPWTPTSLFTEAFRCPLGSRTVLCQDLFHSVLSLHVGSNLFTV